MPACPQFRKCSVIVCLWHTLMPVAQIAHCKRYTLTCRARHSICSPLCSCFRLPALSHKRRRGCPWRHLGNSSLWPSWMFTTWFSKLSHAATTRSPLPPQAQAHQYRWLMIAWIQPLTELQPAFLDAAVNFFRIPAFGLQQPLRLVKTENLK